ncbi:MAG: hypothetical protein HY803_01070 [candidate division NC10 bacterium]|nr:hypothetical protein [candidate division NC10 bacterium]
MKRTGNRPGARPGPATVTRTCGSCGKRFACVARSVADQIGLCLRCKEDVEAVVEAHLAGQGKA